MQNTKAHLNRDEDRQGKATEKSKALLTLFCASLGDSC